MDFQLATSPAHAVESESALIDPVPTTGAGVQADITKPTLEKAASAKVILFTLLIQNFFLLTYFADKKFSFLQFLVFELY